MGLLDYRKDLHILLSYSRVLTCFLSGFSLKDTLMHINIHHDLWTSTNLLDDNQKDFSNYKY